MIVVTTKLSTTDGYFGPNRCCHDKLCIVPLSPPRLPSLCSWSYRASSLWSPCADRTQGLTIHGVGAIFHSMLFPIDDGCSQGHHSCTWRNIMACPPCCSTSKEVQGAWTIFWSVCIIFYRHINYLNDTYTWFRRLPKLIHLVIELQGSNSLTQ